MDCLPTEKIQAILRSKEVSVAELPYDVKQFWNRVVVRSIHHKQSQVIVGDTHSFIGDEPAALGGEGLGPNPFSLILSGLGL